MTGICVMPKSSELPTSKPMPANVPIKIGSDLGKPYRPARRPATVVAKKKPTKPNRVKVGYSLPRIDMKGSILEACVAKAFHKALAERRAAYSKEKPA